ncbi:hypothetical protein GCM10027347_44300 [Larkinella harenae]
MVVNDKPFTEQDAIDNLLYIFADAEVLLVQPRLIRRIDSLDSRYYYTVEHGMATFYISTTSFIKKVMPTSPHLIEWMKKHGEKADILRDEAADFGTLMHICFADYHLKGFDFSKTTIVVTDYLKSLGYQLKQALIGAWAKRLNKAIASYATFCEEFDIQPVLIEGMLASDELGIAGCLDLVAYATVKGVRKLVNIDFKSGGIHDSAKFQLAINQILFEENFPHLEIDECWSWAPKDFKDSPTYTLVNQSKKNVYTPALIDHFLAIYNALYKGELENKLVHHFDGTIRPGRSIADHHRVLGMSDAVAV